MARLIVNQGLQDSLTSDYSTLNTIDSMCVSNFGTLLAATTTVAAATSKDTNLLTSTSRTGQVQTSIGDWTTAEANFAITTITLHRDGVGAFTGLYGGIDGQSLTKTVDATLKITITDTRTSG